MSLGLQLLSLTTLLKGSLHMLFRHFDITLTRIFAPIWHLRCSAAFSVLLEFGPCKLHGWYKEWGTFYLLAGLITSDIILYVSPFLLLSLCLERGKRSNNAFDFLLPFLTGSHNITLSLHLNSPSLADELHKKIHRLSNQRGAASLISLLFFSCLLTFCSQDLHIHNLPLLLWDPSHFIVTSLKFLLYLFLLSLFSLHLSLSP